MAVSPIGIVGRFFGRFFGSTIGEAAGYGIGGALREPIRPLLQELSNETWATATGAGVSRSPGAGVLAEGVAQGQVDLDKAREWAGWDGIAAEQFDALVDIANAGPALELAYSAWRRGELTDGQMRTAFKRAAIEDEWVDALMALKQEPLDPSIIANAVHRGIMRDASLIVREPPTTAGKVEQVPPSPLDPAEEAAWSGLTHERLRVEVGTAGLPPGLVQMLQLLNRGEVTEADVQRAVSQSNLRNEYMDVVLALRRQLLTVHEYEEAALRGIITRDEADAGAALHGMEKDDAQLLFEIMGRPLAVHQITTGLARGGQYGGTYADVPEPYRDAIRRSNIRPEYARLAYANRYTIPSYFILRAILQDGGMTEAQFADYGRQLGWPPDLADAAAQALGGGGGGGSDAHVSKAQTQLWNTTHASYKAGEIDDATVAATLPHAGVEAASIPAVLDTWRTERGLVRATLSAANIRTAYRKQDVNDTTGAAWTIEEAVAALVARGWSAADAHQYLEIG